MSASRPTTPPVLSRRARRQLEAPGGRGDERQARLLEVGERLLTAGTLNDTPISEIAREAGLSRPSFYFYFSSKEELVAELVAQTLSETLRSWSAMIDEPADDPDELADLVRYIVRESARALWENHQPMMRAAVELVPRVPVIREQWLKAVNDTGTELAGLIMRQSRVPELRDPKRAHAIGESLVWMFERSFYFRTLEPCGTEDIDELSATIAEAWIGAMGLRP